MRGDEVVGVPAPHQGIEDRADALLLHRRDHAAQRGAVLFRAARRGAQQADGERAVGMGAGVGRPDHAAQGMADDVDPLVAQLGAQRLEVLDQVVERIGRRRHRAFAVSAQIRRHAGEAVLEMR